MAWWIDLQPEERKAASGDSLPIPISRMPAGANIRNLRKGGPNGIVTVMIALKWWGESKHDEETWKRAVADVQECLDALVLGKWQSSKDGPAKKWQRN